MLPGEIVKITSKRAEVLSEGHINDLKICTFLWTYYGYPNSVYEGVTVETMRTRNGEIMAEHDIQSGNLPDVDFICGVPGFRRSARNRLRKQKRHSVRTPIYKVHPHMAPQLHAAEPVHEKQGCKDEAYSRSRAYRG